MCRALFEEEIANAIEANNNDTRALCFALSRYAERTFEYRTEYVIETLQGLSNTELYDLYMREGAFYDHIKAKGIYTETGTPSLIILTNDTMYRTAGEDSIMNPSKSISLESAPDGSGISARAEIVTPLAKFVKQTCPSEATKMIQVINNLRGKKLLNAVWQEGYLQMILQVVMSQASHQLKRNQY